MKRIPSTLGYEILVDDTDFERLSQFRWYAHNSGNGSTNEKRPARRTGKDEGRKVKFLVHHIVTAPKGMVVDHINGDPWDNRRCNLRVCTNAENLRNRRKHRGSTTNPAKGVYRNGERFVAIITFNDQRHNLGSYETCDEAATAYDAAALYLHGDFARLNFPARNTAPETPEIILSRTSRRSHPKREEVLELIRGGLSGTAAARRAQVSIPTACKWAAEAGLALTRGRPTIERRAA